MKSVLTIFSFLFLLVPGVLFAQGSVYAPLVDLSNAATGNNLQSFEDYINFLYGMSIAVAALLAVIKIVIAGAKYMLSDIISSKGEALADIQGAILGLLLILSAVIILELINPQLVKREITFDELPERPRLPPATAKESMCSQELQTVPYEQGRSCNAILGSGWATIDSDCCSLSDTSRICCGYSEANRGSGSPQPPNIGTGEFTLSIVELDTINECHEELMNRYPTLEACTTAESQARNDNKMAIVEDCSGSVVNTPTNRYNQITSSPYCGADAAPGTYGENIEGYTYTERVTRVDGVAQAAEYKNECEDRFGVYSIKNGPTGTIANATISCRVPSLIKYSGNNSKGRTEDEKDCSKFNGEFDYNLFSASYCILK
jgi:hypothetical protein